MITRCGVIAEWQTVASLLLGLFIYLSNIRVKRPLTVCIGFHTSNKINKLQKLLKTNHEIHKYTTTKLFKNYVKLTLQYRRNEKIKRF